MSKVKYDHVISLEELQEINYQLGQKVEKLTAENAKLKRQLEKAAQHLDSFGPCPDAVALPKIEKCKGLITCAQCWREALASIE